jgi:hypothetical protein
MGILDKKVEAPTPIDSVAHEKNTSSELEMGHSQPHIDPEIEKRVVRKLDWRVPPLVASLCKHSQGTEPPPTDNLR